jgi:hypothetical protein
MRHWRSLCLRGDDAADGEAIGPCLRLLGQFRKRDSPKLAKKGAKTVHLSEALLTQGEYAAVVTWDRNLV